MSVSLWRWTEKCDGAECCGECDLCPNGENDEGQEDESGVASGPGTCL